jgi:hypothetical protein
MLFSLRLLGLTALLLSVGCTSATPTAVNEADKAAAEGDAHAGHDHGHDALGPHGGHLLHLEPTGSHAEWTHDDDKHLLTVHLDEFDAAKVVSAKFVAKIGDTTEEFPLTATDSGWTITSPELMTHINMKDAAQVQLVVVDDTGVHSCAIEAHEHHHH